MDIITLSIFGAALLCYFFYKQQTNVFKNMPGPSRLPLIGNMLDFDKKYPHQYLTKLSQKYGPIYKYSIFGTPVIVVSGADLLWEILVARTMDFSVRPRMYRLGAVVAGADIFLSNGEVHTMRKKFLSKVMKQYGDGMVEMEQLLLRANQELIEYITRKNGEPINLADLLAQYLCNIMGSLIFGEPYAMDDPIIDDVKTLTVLLIECTSFSGPGNELEAMPWLAKIPFYRNNFQDLLDKFNLLRSKILDPRVTSAKAEYEENPDSEGIGMLAKVVRIVKDASGTEEELAYSDEFIKGFCLDTLSGGTETTQKTAYQAILELSQNNSIRERFLGEIDEYVGDSRLPRLSDRNELVYCEAVVNETLRYLTVLPGIVHQTSKDTHLAGYVLPQGTKIYVNLWGLHRNPDVYPDPDTFDPDRMLKTKTDSAQPFKGYLPFSAGKRVCPAEIFARARVFLLVTSLFQHFNVEIFNKSEFSANPLDYEADGLMQPPGNALVTFKPRA